MKLDRSQLVDVLERALFTYAQSVCGLLLAGPLVGMNGLSTIKMAAVSGLPAALSVLKGYMASVMPIGDASASSQVATRSTRTRWTGPTCSSASSRRASSIDMAEAGGPSPAKARRSAGPREVARRLRDS